jgi:myo-inositol-1(or 4)-monophosphatase
MRSAAEAALSAYTQAVSTHSREELASTAGMGADGTPTMRIDVLVESAVLSALAPHGVNVLSEETGWVDVGSARTLVIDPLDGSANGAAGVPLTAFSAALAVDGTFVEALTVWLDTGRSWWARRGEPSLLRTSGRTTLDGAAISMLRPHAANPSARSAWWAAAEKAKRVRILSSTCLEAALVCDGATDAFADAATQTHRLVDLAAAVVLAEAAGGAVVDVFGSPVELDVDLTRRWSGVVAATPSLADELASVIRTAAEAAGK